MKHLNDIVWQWQNIRIKHRQKKIVKHKNNASSDMVNSLNLL